MEYTIVIRDRNNMQQSVEIDREFYNPDTKTHFLSILRNVDTVNYYARILEKTKRREERFNKDLYDFTYDEIISTLRSFNYKSRDTLQGTLSIISQYIDFARAFNYKPQEFINVAKNAISLADLDKLVDVHSKIRRYIYSWDELKGIIHKKTENAQDSVGFCLAFEGLNGVDFEEIRNLQEFDVNRHENILKVEKTVYVYDGSDDTWTPEKRKVDFPVSSFTMDVIVEAIEQEQYTNPFGGPSTRSTRDYSYSSLADTGYVVRPSGKRKFYGPVNGAVIYRRVKYIAAKCEKHPLTPTTILYSGAAIYAQELTKERGLKAPDLDVYRDVCERYGLNPGSSMDRLKRTYKFISDPDNIEANDNYIKDILKG